ncbi:nitric oxide-associated protein 1-like [Amphiura filiformis]|uniref:nitric oxide-associated protein 1-like n=1 Tax=Amphiura filiformis TaxID=82378 RepID=UPI003B21111E
MHRLDESDELIDIHDPQGREIPSENFNEFDVQYFGGELENLSAETSFVRHENVGSDDPLEKNEECEVEVDTDLNEFDQQWFGGAVFDKPIKRKGQIIPSVASKPWSVDADVNDIDKQYFGASASTGLGYQTNNRADIGHGEPVFLDTSCNEETILWEQKKKDRLSSLEQEMGLVQEKLSETKFKLHDEATRVDFKEKINSEMHENVKFDDDQGAKSLDIPSKLQKELIAERKIVEQNQMRQQNIQHDDDLEPEVRATLMSLKKKKKMSTSEKLLESIDSGIATSNKPCSGCGAFLQCNSVDKPGFMSKQSFLSFMEKVEAGNITTTMKALCVRCWNLIKQKEALHVSVNQDDYTNIVKAIRKKRSLVLVMVDLLDFPCSFIPSLQDVIGNKHVCLVGNKMDILPVDSRDYSERIKKHLLEASVKAGVCTKENVQGIFLVSAKTGYGIERLITQLHKNWGTQGDVYLLGTANVGKSTLFNRLLESDYCKSKASYLMGKATISRWPGTTLNLLRFPIMNLNKTRVAQRVERLKADREADKNRLMEDKFSKMRGQHDAPKKELDTTGYFKDNVGRTFDYYKDIKELDFHIGEDPFNIVLGKSSEHAPAPKSESKLPFDFHPNEFDDGRWFYDTPGVIHNQQVLTKLTLKELKAVVPETVIQPKTVVIKPGQTFFLAGLGRLDYLQGAASIYFTLFTCRRLPIRVVKTEEADSYYAQHAGQKLLAVPMGGDDRMKSFPALESFDMDVKGIGWKESAADILFSSAGWASVTAGGGMEVKLRAYTPGGNGCLLRQPSLLPYAILMKGQRIKGTPYYGINRDKLVKFMS